MNIKHQDVNERVPIAGEVVRSMISDIKKSIQNPEDHKGNSVITLITYNPRRMPIGFVEVLIRPDGAIVYPSFLDIWNKEHIKCALNNFANC